MRRWGFRVFFMSRRHEYTEWEFPSHRDAYRFAMDFFTSDPDIWKLVVTDSAGRREPFVLNEQRVAA